MAQFQDGPSSSRFWTLELAGSTPFEDLAKSDISEAMRDALPHAPTGECVGWGIPFEIQGALVIKDQVVQTSIPPTQAAWLMFLHTADIIPLPQNPDGFVSPVRGKVPLAQKAAEYVIGYEDGSEMRVPILFRHQIGFFRTVGWGEGTFQAVTHGKPYPDKALHEQLRISEWGWGFTQTRISADMYGDTWQNYIWAWENPQPHKRITALRFEPGSGVVLVSAVSAGQVDAHPLRWEPRQKALLRLPPGTPFRPDLSKLGLLEQVQLDLGQVISASPRMIYPNATWEQTEINSLPQVSETEILVEYSAHPEACFYLSDGAVIPVSQLQRSAEENGARLEVVQPARKKVVLKVVEAGSRKPVAVKLHIHGEHDEYLPPVDRHRIINDAWFEDFSVDFLYAGRHASSYINGQTTLNLPLGKVYLEISKGFEIRPIRRVIDINPDTSEILIEIERILAWRSWGWVTADTHVHFLSPGAALLEGAAEGLNVINLLASQWGELVTNVGDFDGRTTWGEKDGSPEGDGETLVRVGTENRQAILGHISLLGYSGSMIAPMTTGGPNESALGDPVEVLLTEWARQCKAQGGLVVLPHFPNPRCEPAAVICAGEADAIEMIPWNDQLFGIDPYSLSDWYRYLNCGYLIPAVGGTDKMAANIAVGTIRTYAQLLPDEPFSYQNWMKAVRCKKTFVTYGPLLDFMVEGQPMGSQINLPAGGGRLDVTWQVASVTTPITRVELIVNGEIRQSQAVAAQGGSGNWLVSLEKSAWMALLVRGQPAGQVEMIAAHSSPVMVQVQGSHLFAAADALTILDQIEGAIAFIDTIGVRASDEAYKRMRLELTSTHRRLHNRLHEQGVYHAHNNVADHHES